MRIFSVIILAAGESTRMHEPKAFLKAVNGDYFLEIICKEYKKAGCNQIICVINEKVFNYFRPIIKKLKTSCEFVINREPDKGRYYSIKMGAKHLRGTHPCFIQNIDNPNIDDEIIESLFNVKNEHSYIVPEYNDKTGHPILVGKQIISDILKEKKNDIRLNDFLKNYNRISVKVQSSSIHQNINTPEDYSKYLTG